jgi:hypothetical protein
MPPKLPLPIEKRLLTNFVGFPCSVVRLLFEICFIAIAGIAVFSLPVLFMSHPPPNYEQAVFLPMVSQALEKPPIISILLVVVVSFAAGVFGRGPVWLAGPATTLAFPIWAVIDGLAGGGGHNMIPFEIIMYGFFAMVCIGPTTFGRLARFLIELWRSHDASYEGSSVKY